MKNILRSLLTMSALVLCFSFTAVAQETTGDIEGTIKDPNGAVVPGVVVTVRSSGTSVGARPDSVVGFTRTVTADGSGFYRMQQVPPGSYTVTTAATSGFGEASKTNVQVLVGRSTLTDFALSASGSSNVVDVVADAGIAIDPTSNKVLANITSQTIDLLPKGTNFTSLLQTTPSVRNEPLSGGFQIDGASGSENTFVIDGQEVSNFRTGTLNVNNNVPFQIVQEIQVKSAGFEAEFGGATGGVISVATKSGGNDFHGEVGTAFEIAKFQGNPRPFFRDVNIGASAPGVTPVVTALRTTEEIQTPKDGGTNSFPSIFLSGPIIKDRVWFFAAYAPQYFNLDRTTAYQTADPRTRSTVATELYTQRVKREYAFGKIDAQLFRNLRMTASYLWNPVEQIGAPDASTNFSGTVPSQLFPSGQTFRGGELLNMRGGRQTSNNTNASLIWTPTSRLVITGRAGYSFLNEKIGNYGVPSTVGSLRYVVQNFNTPVPAGFGGFGAAGFGQNFPGFQPPQFDATIRRTFDTDASYLFNAGGRHQIKGGFQFNGISNQVNSTLVDTVVIRFGQNIRQTSGISNQPISPTAIGSGFLQRFAVFGAAGSDNRAFYIQDTWQPVSRLTLNIGVRTEKEESPSFSAGNPGITFGYGDKIAPRLGFAFDLTGDGKTKIFGSYGRFYDRFKYELPRGSFGGNFFRNDYFEIFPGQTLNTFTRQSIIGTNPDPIGGACPLATTTGFTRCQRDFRIPSNLVGGSAEEFGAVDPDIKAFQQSEYTFGFERDLGRGFLFTSRYTHKQVDFAVEDIGTLTAGGGEAYIIGNPGFGLAKEFYEESGFIAPKAVRDYDAGEFRVVKRFATTAYFDASYTYSRLFGNYAGLASSDEAGRTSPNVNRNFDLPFIGFSALGQPDNGRLPTDRPHSFKVSGSYSYNWSGSNATELSGFQIIQSGTPVTTRFTFDGVTGQILNGRGDLGRTESFTQTDFGVSHKYRFGRDNRLTLAFDLDILNLFDEANVITVNETISPTNISFGADDLNLTNDLNRAIQIYQTQATNARILPFLTSGTNGSLLYGQPLQYQGPRSVRFGFRMLF